MHKNADIKTQGGTRVCVIGAGPAGLSVLYNFSKLPVVPDIVCFEKQETWGGMWNYSWLSGTDEYGEPCHAGMYKHLWINFPKECAEYPDYTFDKHFGKAIPSYAPRAVHRDYLEGRFRSCPTDLNKYIRYRSVVKNVSHRNDGFIVTWFNLETDTTSSEIFSHVIVATGVYSCPNKPYFPGLETFPGRIVHSHDVRDAEEFKDQHLLLVGNSVSGDDLALQTIKFGAKSAVLSWRTKPAQYKWPNSIEERPLLQKVQGREVFFKDGTSAVFDSIILCTGYVYHFPFLEDDLRLKCPHSLFPDNLYKGALYLKGGDNKLFYIGIQKQVYTFTMFEVMSAWICRYIMGTLDGEPKDEAEMRKDVDVWLAREKGLKDCSALHELAKFQTDHVLDLCRATGYTTEITKFISVFYEWERNRNTDITTYRDHCHTSIFSGTKSLKPRRPWLEEFDDSVEGFLGKQ